MSDMTIELDDLERPRAHELRRVHRAPAADAVGGDRVRRTPRLMLVPTTAATASEVSMVAAMHAAGRKRLGVGKALVADIAVIDPAPLGTLTVRTLRLGAVETVARLLVPALCGPARPIQDGLITALVAGTVRAAQNVGPTGAQATRLDAEAALSLAAMMSGAGLIDMGRDPFGHRLWFLSSEVALACGVAKNEAQAALLVPFLRAIEDRRYGGAVQASRDRAVQLCSAWPDAQAGPGLASAVEERLTSWGLPTRLDELTVPSADDLARRTLAEWGGDTGPVRCGVDELAEFYSMAGATTGPRPLTARRRMIGAVWVGC